MASGLRPWRSGLRENRGRQRPWRPFHLRVLVSSPRDQKKLSARREEAREGRERLRQKRRRQRLQRVALVYEIEPAPPFRRRGEEICGAILDLRSWKAAPRPGDGPINKIKRRDLRAGGGKIFGVVAKAATDVEDAKPVQTSRLKIDEGSRERVGAKIGPGDAGRIIAGARINRLEPDAAEGIGVRRAALGGIDRIEFRARFQRGARKSRDPRAPRS